MTFKNLSAAHAHGLFWLARVSSMQTLLAWLDVVPGRGPRTRTPASPHRRRLPGLEHAQSPPLGAWSSALKKQLHMRGHRLRPEPGPDLDLTKRDATWPGGFLRARRRLLGHPVKGWARTCHAQGECGGSPNAVALRDEHVNSTLRD